MQITQYKSTKFYGPDSLEGGLFGQASNLEQTAYPRLELSEGELSVLLKKIIDEILQTPDFTDSEFEITFDEDAILQITKKIKELVQNAKGDIDLYLEYKIGKILPKVANTKDTRPKYVYTPLTPEQLKYNEDADSLWELYFSQCIELNRKKVTDQKLVDHYNKEMKELKESLHPEPKSEFDYIKESHELLKRKFQELAGEISEKLVS